MLTKKDGKKGKGSSIKYVVIDHEADVGLEIYGNSIEELFINAAEGLFSLIVLTDLKNIEAQKGKRLNIDANGELLVLFLNELLYLWDTEGFIPKEFSIKIEDGKLRGNVVGGLFDPVKYKIRQEVKAVTYHRFFMMKDEGRYTARIILDV